MILSRYIAWRYLWLFLRVLAAFLALMLTIDVIDQFRRFSSTSITLAEALRFSAMNVPASLYSILPLVQILAAIGLFLGLARSSELVVIRAAGRSGLRFLMAPLFTSLAIGALAVAVLNPFVAATSREYDRLTAGRTQGASVLSVTGKGIWLRQGAEDGQTVVQARRANLDGTELFDATFLTFSTTGALTSRTDADVARLGDAVWHLEGAKTWALRDDNPERTAVLPTAGSTFPTDLTPEKIRDGFGTPSGIAIWDLPGYIADLERAGFSARAHRVWMQTELALPATFAAMMLMAAGFTMRHARSGGTGVLVLGALLCGFALFFLRNFGQVLGENGQIPVSVAAWAPPVSAILLSLGLILHLEDG